MCARVYISSFDIHFIFLVGFIHRLVAHTIESIHISRFFGVLHALQSTYLLSIRLIFWNCLVTILNCTFFGGLHISCGDRSKKEKKIPRKHMFLYTYECAYTYTRFCKFDHNAINTDT